VCLCMCVCVPFLFDIDLCFLNPLNGMKCVVLLRFSKSCKQSVSASFAKNSADSDSVS